MGRHAGRLMVSAAVVTAVLVLPIGVARPHSSPGDSSPRSATTDPTPYRSGAASQSPIPVADVRVDDATIVVYGDSLVWESEDYLEQAFAGEGAHDLHIRSFGGTAICDWIDVMRTDAAELHPTLVVLEFSGNALTPCMAGPDGVSLGSSRDAYLAKYAADAREAVGIFAGTARETVFVAAPISRAIEARHDPDAGRLNAMYAGMVSRDGRVRFVDAGEAVLRDGRYTDVLPCLPVEPCTGGVDADGVAVNVVRAPDGAHFCPGAPDASNGVTERCAIWSSGAYRFANAIASGVVAQFGVSGSSSGRTA